jgi:hypothetical protein
MLRFIFIVIFSLSSFISNSQDVILVKTKGVGIDRKDAIQDALRNAVSEGIGVSIKSQSQVENYILISDAISSSSKGYIKKYEIVGEAKLRDQYEISILAEVTKSSLEADFSLLAKLIGGVRFLTIIDPNVTNQKHIETLNKSIELIHQNISKKGSRYIDKNRFELINHQAKRMFESTKEPINYVQQLGLMADAQFVIMLTNVQSQEVKGRFDIRRGNETSFEAKIIDNCTAEGLGSIRFNIQENTTNSFENEVNKKFDSLFSIFTNYVGSWIQNGTPFELRFYNMGSFRDFRTFRKAIKANPSFGGDIELVSVFNYTKLNCTFKKQSDDLADVILDISDEIPNFNKLKIDVKKIYGRQISFAPQNYIIPEIINKDLNPLNIQNQ